MGERDRVATGSAEPANISPLAGDAETGAGADPFAGCL